MAEIPENPITRKEAYLAAIAGQDVALPDKPLSREEQYLNYIAENGGGGGASDYGELENKPQIGGVTLQGNKTASDLGLVAEETGKGLSSEDYTAAEKTKLSGIEPGAEANVQADWEESDSTSDAYIQNKPAFIPVFDGAGFHNSIYRGQYLGDAVTETQWAAIADGTFDGLFIGDYWTIGGRNWRIAAFDYWYNTGDANCTTHHAVIVPNASLYQHSMNDADTTEGGYVGSKMYTEGLDQAKAMVAEAFGDAHILNHREYLINAVSGANPNAGDWYDSTVELMNERMVYGCPVYEPMAGVRYTIDKSQLPLFWMRHDLIGIRATWWLRGVAGAASFAYVSSRGYATTGSASAARGVRPAFGIH